MIRIGGRAIKSNVHVELNIFVLQKFSAKENTFPPLSIVKAVGV
jgi:hypothetical protein